MSFFKKLFQKNNEESPSKQFYRFPVLEIIRETDKAVTLVFEKPDEHFEFLPGQYLTLKKVINGKEVRRAYSLNNLPNETQLKVTVKETVDGFFSKYINRELQVGDLIDVMPPTGKFTYQPDENKERHIVAFAGGSGITPVSSIIQSLLANEPKSKITLFYGNRTRDDIIFKQSLESLLEQHPKNFELIHILSDEEVTGFTPYYGFIDEDMIQIFSKKYFSVDNIDTYYICGPGQMITIIEKALLKIGVQRNKIKKELFTAPLESNEVKTSSEKDDAEEIKIPAKIQAKYSYEEKELTYTNKKDSVLDTALNAGMKIPFSCLNGVCSTCSAKLLKGTVKMEQNFALEEVDIENGYILTCQSRPTSAEIEVDWDDNRI